MYFRLLFFLSSSCRLFRPSNYIITIIIIILFINITVTGIRYRYRGRVPSKEFKQHVYPYLSSLFRSAYRTHVTPDMELSVILVNGFRPLYNVTRCLVLVVVRVLDLRLIIIVIIIGRIIIINVNIIAFIITRIFEQKQFTVR